MSVTTEITRLQNGKSSIKTSIENKGVTVPDSAKLDVYHNYINNIVTDSVYPKNVQNISIAIGNEQLTIKWNDPDDTVVEEQVICTWAGTKLIMKEGSYPTNPTDGTLVVDNQEKNAYAGTGYTVTGLTNNTTYYFRLFPYSTNGVYNTNDESEISGTPVPFKTMTVVIDQSNSNPSNCITYADDAVNMTAGSSEWDNFFKHYPCLLKNGEEVGKLNPNDFSKFEDGTDADITSGNAGDVMIAFPRMGVKISTSGNILTVSMTDDPNKDGYTYYAHQRGSTDKDVFYLGAYKGYELSSKLRSLSGKAPTVSKTIGAFRTLARANGGSDGNGGSGYDQSGFYQLIFRQVMYLLKYKNLDSQTALGRGYVDGNSAKKNTGGTNTKGMDFGETTGKQQMKLFGLEDFWGNIYEWIDGLFCNSSRHILTGTQGFNDTGSGYTDQGQGASSNLSNYISKVQGTSETGFIAKEVSGSTSTYYCDYGSLYAGYLPSFGGAWFDGSAAGAFLLDVDSSASGSYDYLGGRLMYL